MDGATILARSLKEQGVEYCFGVTGFPVLPVSLAMQREGIKFIGMRLEQSACYAAAAMGYLTKRPGLAMTVSGPGFTNAITGLGHAQANCWPMLLISGASGSDQTGMGAFQESVQLDVARPFVKYAMRPDSQARIPFYVAEALRYSLYGRPGPTYLEFTDDIIVGRTDEPVRFLPRVTELPPSVPESAAIAEAICAIREAERPLIIIGKGAAYARAEHDVRTLVENTGTPFLCSPMGRGLVPDNHFLSANAARSYALQNADLVVLLGARFNWTMHFGLPPRYSPEVRVIQIDIEPEEIGRNVPATVGLVGDVGAIVRQMNQQLAEEESCDYSKSPWVASIHKKAEENSALMDPLKNDVAKPMGFYRAVSEIGKALPGDAVVVMEGATSMDVSRQMLVATQPRYRLDAGSWGTMGVGPAQAIAAQLAYPGNRVVAIEGDSAFGFGAMEVEVACRLGLPIVFIVLNNNGMGGGPDVLGPLGSMPPTALYPAAHYERVIEAFGGLGYYIDDPEYLAAAIRNALETERPCLINVQIDNQSRRRSQEFGWHTGITATKVS